MSTHSPNAHSSAAQQHAVTSPSKTNHFNLKKADLYCLSLCDDQGDRKALNALVDKLIASSVKNKRAQHQNSCPSSSKYRQLSMSKFCVTSSGTEVSYANKSSSTVQSTMRKPKSERNVGSRSKKGAPQKTSNDRMNKKTSTSTSAKLTSFDGWFSRNNSKSAENCTKVENAESKRKKIRHILSDSSDSNTPPMSSPTKKSARTLSRQSSGSFAKYGMCVPTFEDILAYQKKFEEQKQCIESIGSMEDSRDPLNFNLEEPVVPEVILDCKHLTEEEIREAFKCNYQYVYDIFHGVRYSARHDRFKKENHKNQGTIKDLKYNTSMSTFTFEQKQLLLTHLRKMFDSNDDTCSNNQYYFKVLLPELCMKIFMDVHNMSYDEAAAYLEVRPVRY